MQLLTWSVACLALCAAADAQFPGAIWTSNQKGDVVNGNVYKSESAVYLNGGPGPNTPCTQSGLPDGNYYFQVTDPSGRSCPVCMGQ